MNSSSEFLERKPGLTYLLDESRPFVGDQATALVEKWYRKLAQNVEGGQRFGRHYLKALAKGIFSP